MAATKRPVRRKPGKNFRHGLRRIPLLAAGLGTLAAGNAHAQSSVDMRLLYYKEDGGRTEVIDPVLLLRQDLGETLGQLNILASYNAISGASPTGGYPTLDVTTSASGNTVASGRFPLAQYEDHRHSVAATWQRRFGAHLPSIDLSYSKENDYVARGGSLSDAWTLVGGRGTLHLGASFSRDTVSAVTNNLHRSKSTNGFSLGWTWVVGERDLVDVSASLTRISGYLDDPYKIVAIGTPVVNETLPERRPDRRDRRALVAKWGHSFPWDGALKTSYRFYNDSWGIQAHAVELDYDQHLGSDWIVSPRIRFYTQDGATFYDSLFATEKSAMSADYRLSPMNSLLGELALSWAATSELSLNAGASFQNQRGRDRITPYAPLRRDDDEDEGGRASSVSAADLKVFTVTIGFSRRF